MTIKPGEETTLTMTYMMHGTEMGGQHQFDIHVLSNDPAQPEAILVARSNWVE